MKEINIDDRGGTGTQTRVKYDNDSVTLIHYNDNFTHEVMLTTDTFCELARHIIYDYMNNSFEEEDDG
jgi:hypothetical protein